MAEIKIAADAGGGSVGLKGPASTTDNAAVQLTLPVDDGAANTWLKSNGSGVTSWAAPTATEIATSSGTASNSTYLRGDNTWATVDSGSRTLISTTTLSGTSTSLTSLDFSDYLYLEATIYSATAASNLGDFYIRFNNDTGGNYRWLASRMDNNGNKSHGGDQSGSGFYINMTGVAGYSSSYNWAHFELRNINISSSKKLFRMNSGGLLTSSGAGPIVLDTTGWWDNSNAITRIDINCSTSITGGSIKLYGVN